MHPVIPLILFFVKSTQTRILEIFNLPNLKFPDLTYGRHAYTPFTRIFPVKDLNVDAIFLLAEDGKWTCIDLSTVGFKFLSPKTLNFLPNTEMA